MMLCVSVAAGGGGGGSIWVWVWRLRWLACTKVGIMLKLATVVSYLIVGW